MITLTIAFYELKRMLRNKSVTLLLFVTPLVLIIILGSALSDFFEIKDQKIVPVNLAVYTESDGTVSKGFDQFIVSKPISKHFHVIKSTSLDDLKESVKKGKADMGIYIPESFDRQVLSGNNAAWQYVLGRDSAKNMKGQAILDSFIDETNRMQAVAASLGQKAAVTSSADARQGTNQSFVQDGALGGIGKRSSAIQYYSASMLIMFLLYAGLTAAISLVKEKEDHTLDRLNAMPVLPIQILVSKLIGNGMLAGLQALFIILVTKYVYGVNWGVSPVSILFVCLFTIVGSMGLAFLTGLVARSTRTIGGAFAAFVGIMTFISGGMAPHEGGIMQVLQKFTLNYWASSSLLETMLGGDTADIVRNLTVLGSIGVLLLSISLLVYRKVGYNE